MIRHRIRLLASASLAGALIAGAAHAQTNNVIEELVVTAEKREQSLQDVPVAISAFTSKSRDLVGINTIQDLTNFTPGFVYQSANDRASMRGIGRLTNVHSVDGAVSIYVDGLFTTSTVLAGGPPIETDRVEILRGPQGTLYGRNAIGGTVNVITARPTETPYAEVRAIAENYGVTNFQFAASGPLAEGLQVRVSGYKADQSKGYYTNIAKGMPSEGNVRDEYEIQFQAKAQLGENAEFWMKYMTLQWDNRGGPGARAGFLNGPYETGLTDPNYSIVYASAHGYSPETGLAGIVPGSLQQFNGVTATTNPALSDPRKFNTNYPQHVTLTDVHSFTANFTYHMPTFDIKYVGGLQNYRYDLRGDTDATSVKSYQIPLAPGSICGTIATLFTIGRSAVNCAPQTVNADNIYHYFEYPEWYSHEINLASTTDGPLQWIAGLYYYNEKYTGTGSTADFFLNGSSSLQTPILGAAANPEGIWSSGHYALTTESKAAFGQIDWQATEQLKFTLGLRYTKDRKFGTEFRRIVCNSDVCYTGLYPALGLSGFGPGTAANWGSLLGNLAALPAVGQALGLGNALAPLGGLGNGGMDLTATLAPTTTAAGAKGVTSPVVCTGAVCKQYTIDPATGVAARNLGDTSDALTGTFGVQWDPNEDTMVYGRYSRGYKAFGLSAGSFLVAPEAAPEFVNSYEIGFKTNFGRTLQLNAALYYLDYRDLQAPVTVRVGPTNVNQFVNIAKSRSSGLELDATWQPIQPLRLNVSYSYNDTSIREADKFVDVNDNVNTGAVSIVGNRLPQAPKNKVAVNGSYSFFMEPGTLTLSASYIYRDEAYANIFTKPWNEAPSWDQVDLRAHWAPKDNKYTIIAYVKNVGDTLGYDAAVVASNRNRSATVASDQFLNGGQNLELTPPRTYGIEFQYRFF
ncbi:MULTISPECIES: TonB-dependent receptor [Phenylobacterium]|jgi:iron complex outermembrane receptor protein|uniref:TonB-dependent receptor n=1 Tax=Phenylobacterium conjunctum TaxID=1298959 RepID=A0ABW3T325_9CAUL